MLPRGRCEFVNMYGITETTVHVTALRLDRSAALDGRRSVGRAIPGWRISVRDLLGRLRSARLGWRCSTAAIPQLNAAHPGPRSAAVRDYALEQQTTDAK